MPVRRDEHLRIMMDLLVLALWTDTTRVATLMAAHGFSRQNFSFLDGVTSDHHAISHHKNQPEGGGRLHDGEPLVYRAIRLPRSTR